jgi:branched-chain amino acid transport system ATP-binding protein
LLQVKELTKAFGGLVAVDKVDLAVEEKQIVALIGPNGSGKTTMLNLITGVYSPTNGSIRFDGREVAGLPPFRVTRLGICRTFQTIRLFPELTVLENVMVGQHCRSRAGAVRAMLATPGFRREEERIRATALASLEVVGLAQKKEEFAGNLAAGQQRLLEMARALASQPALLLLDEPVAGMNPSEKAHLSEVVKGINARGLSILLVEHDMHFVMNLVNQVYVLNFGRKIAEGTPAAIQANPIVQEAYLGRRAANA